MSEELLPESIVAAAEHLAGLDAEARKREWKKLRGLVLAQTPDEDVGRPPVRRLGEYLDAEIELPPMLVEPGLIARGAITALVSRGGKGKTALSLNRLLRWSAGRPLFDELPEINVPVKPLRVLVIENEGAPGHFQDILTRIVSSDRYTDEDRELARENVHVWGDGGWSGLKLDDAANLELVSRGIEQTQADIVFVEPFRGLWRGEENSSTEMGNVLDSLNGLANQHACGVIVTHHERKSAPGEGGDQMDVARGSGVMEGAAAVMERWRPVKNGQYRELSWLKNRFQPAPGPIRMEFNFESWSYSFVPEERGERDVLNFLSQFPDTWMTMTDIAAELDENYAKVRRWCKSLEEDDRLAKRAIEGKISYRTKNVTNGDDEADGLGF